MNIALILAGGMGSRMGQDIPKQFIHVDNCPIVVYTLLTMQRHPEIDRIQAVCIDGWEKVLSGYAEQFGITKLTGIAGAGETRYLSTRQGMESLGDVADEDVIIVHDSVRPLVTEESLSDVIAVCRKYGNSMSVLDCADTMYDRTEEGATAKEIARESLVRGQTPEAVSGKRMREMYAASDPHGLHLGHAGCPWMEGSLCQRGGEEHQADTDRGYRAFQGSPEDREGCVAEMKALNLHGVGDLRHEDVAMPVRGVGEVLLKIRAVGICGSDIPRVFAKGTYHFPTIIGHEFAGEIVEAKDRALVGRGAAVFPLLPCGTCEACRTEHYAQCSDYDYYGSRRDGAMAEYLAVRRENLCLLPEGVSYEEAAMSEPAAVALHAFRKSGVGAGDTILIYGIGTIGLILAQWARTAGARRIVLVGRTDDKVDFAKKLGFPLALNGRRESPEKFVQRVTDGRGADACIEGTGESKPWEMCIRYARNYGTVVSMGNPVEEMQLSQDGYWKILRKELRIVGTWNSSFGSRENDWREAVKAMQDKRLELKSLITHRFSLDEYQEAFSLMHERREMYCKVMFVM